MILGLIGGKNIKKYTIADYLWSEISRIARIKFYFQIFPVESFQQLCQFYWSFLENQEFIGFNVALPWKGAISTLVDKKNYITKDCKFVNTIYKQDNISHESCY